MSTPAKAHEPTMEEILASIRRIISDDEAPAAAAPARPAGGPRPAAPPQPAPVPEALGQDDIDEMFSTSDQPTEPSRAAPKPAEPARVAPKPVLPPPPIATRKPARSDDLDVLELTPAMQEPPPASAAPGTPAAAPIMRGPVRPAPPPAVSAAPEPPPAAPPPADRLLSAESDDAVSKAFGSLANTILSNNARTIDDLVREMLRPMLRAWLDDNLPPLVERLVRAEIERVARGGR